MHGAGLLAMLIGVMATATPLALRAQSPPYVVVQDGIPKPIAGERGDAARGRAIVANRSVGLCLLCHGGPFPEERFQGTLAPTLAGAGARWNQSQLRLRIVDATRANPDTIMPPYFRTDGLRNVAKPFVGRTIFTAQQVEDVVAYLVTLRD
jgi:sulfur-oxidizing protein SoxX